MVGKWHLGNKPEDHPLRHGFDEFFGVLESDHPYYGEQEQSSKPFHNPILRGTTPVAARGYLTDTFAAEAAAFIATHASRPFFLYVPFTATHGPLQAKPELLTKLSFIKDDKRRLFAAVLASLDEAVGTITAALRKARIARNTVVVFLGDNGCASGHGCSNRPLRGGKYSLYEGGIRAPFILAWPGQVTAGRRYAKPVAAFDLFATFVHAAGGTPAGVVDGVNLLPFLQGRTGSPHPVLFWGGSKAGAIRKGNWKLIGTELYDLSTDVRETHDVAAAHPSVVASLRSARSRWLSGLAPALW
jgi:arylsulfatase B